ncbi:MAG TPA: hypothetical protein VF794_22015 [Archangium sp.]|jgi:hypothetical protein|uniref:hypothetical protein n=1 Tax=Archangium sp. TaxID=1872627 RepID=UPI002ED96DDF
MARRVLAWLAVFGLMGPAGAQEVQGGERGEEAEAAGLPEDVPDNMDSFRRTPQTDDVPQTDEQQGTGGSGTAGTGEQAPVEQESMMCPPPEQKPEAGQSEAPRS